MVPGNDHAGTAAIIQGELAQVGPVAAPVGWYQKFTPNQAYSGQVRVGFRLVSALGASNTGTVTYNLAFDASKPAEEIDALVHDFVRTRQNLIASTIKVPGLIDRRQMAVGTDTVTTRMTPSTDGITLGFSNSLAQMEAARDKAYGVAQPEISPFNIWLNGTFLMHNRKDNGNKWGNSV